MGGAASTSTGTGPHADVAAVSPHHFHHHSPHGNAGHDEDSSNRASVGYDEDSSAVVSSRS